MMKNLFYFAAFLCCFATVVRAQENDQILDNEDMVKARAAYWNNMLTCGTEKDLDVIKKKAFEAFRNMENPKAFNTLSSVVWTPVASSVDGHSSGRISSLAVDPHNPNTVYIAASGGGIWKTNDITQTPPNWVCLTDRLPTTNFGSIAIDPNNSQRIFAATGEAGGDNYQGLYGAGIYRSDDGGMNWTNICGADTLGSVCSQIIIDSTNSQNIYIASGQNYGILKTTNGGTSWRKISVGGQAPLSITYSSKAPTYLYAGCVGGSPGTGSPTDGGSIYRSTDAGETWTKTSTGITGAVARVDLACSYDQPNIVYASIGSTNNHTLGIWVSTDSAKTWRNKMTYNSANPESNTNANPLGNQESYANTIVVRPNHANQILVGGLDIYWSTDSGLQMTKVSDWTASPNNNSYVHADIHKLVFTNGGSTLYACTDGGIAVTTSSSSYQNWNTTINEGLATLMFVGVDATKDFAFISGGCQDNGTLKSYANGTDFHLTRSGDGGRGWVSPDDSNIVYSTYVYSTFYKSLDAAKTWGSNLLEPNPNLYRDPSSGAGTGEGAPFYPAYDVSADGNVVAYGGNNHVWISTNGGADAFPNHSDVSMPTVYCIHVSQGDSYFMWAGGVSYNPNSSTSFWHSFNQGVNWTRNNMASGEGVTGITSDPNNVAHVYVSTQGTGGATKHFWVSNDTGKTFTSPSNALAGIPCWSVAFNPKNGYLFVGSDNGVLYSSDGGVSWTPMNNGMPYTRITSLRVKGTNNDILLAGTYGRGTFKADISTLGGVVATTAPGAMPTIDAVYPNPMTNTVGSLSYTVPADGFIELSLYDLLGREQKIISKEYVGAGQHTLQFSTTDLAKGTYVVGLIANGKTVSKNVVIE